MASETQFTKYCANPGCSLRGLKVKLGRGASSCVACGRELSAPAQSLIDTLKAQREQRGADFVENVIDSFSRLSGDRSDG